MDEQQQRREKQTPDDLFVKVLSSLKPAKPPFSGVSITRNVAPGIGSATEEKLAPYQRALQALKEEREAQPPAPRPEQPHDPQRHDVPDDVSLPEGWGTLDGSYQEKKRYVR